MLDNKLDIIYQLKD